MTRTRGIFRSLGLAKTAISERLSTTRFFIPSTQKLEAENGRRALLMFSDGEDNSSSHDMMTTIEAAQAANVVVFTIRYTEKEHGKLTARNQYGIRVMDRIAKETGGADDRRGKY